MHSAPHARATAEMPAAAEMPATPHGVRGSAAATASASTASASSWCRVHGAGQKGRHEDDSGNFEF